MGSHEFAVKLEKVAQYLRTKPAFKVPDHQLLGLESLEYFWDKDPVTEREFLEDILDKLRKMRKLTRGSEAREQLNDVIDRIQKGSREVA